MLFYSVYRKKITRTLEDGNGHIKRESSFQLTTLISFWLKHGLGKFISWWETKP